MSNERLKIISNGASRLARSWLSSPWSLPDDLHPYRDIAIRNIGIREEMNQREEMKEKERYRIMYAMCEGLRNGSYDDYKDSLEKTTEVEPTKSMRIVEGSCASVHALIPLGIFTTGLVALSYFCKQ